jgi:hypothetical protein
MKNAVLKLVFGLSLCFGAFFAAPQTTSAQSEKIPISQRDYENQSVEMADTFREEGKIYVVVAVMLTLFAGLVGLALKTERDVKQVEREVKSLREELQHKIKHPHKKEEK